MSRSKHSDSLQGDGTELSLLSSIRNETQERSGNETISKSMDKTIPKFGDAVRLQQVVPVTSEDQTHAQTDKVNPQRKTVFDYALGWLFRMRSDQTGLSGRADIYRNFNERDALAQSSKVKAAISAENIRVAARQIAQSNKGLSD